MKRVLFICLVAALSLISCNQPRKIVTDTPIKTDILGIKLCETMTVYDVQSALMENTDKYFVTTPQKNGNEEVFRAITMDWNFNYGGLAWTYIDVGVTKDSEVFAAKIVGSYESEESAKQQYDAAVAIFTQKYGKGNNVSENNIFWTDDVNSVGLMYYKSSSVDGSDRSFCELYYVNNALTKKVEAESQLDI